MPITQWGILGQTLLVFSYRSAAELLNVLTNLTGMSEISLWCEHQSVALHIINQFKVLYTMSSFKYNKPHCNFGRFVTGTSHLGQWIRFLRARI